MAKINKLNLKLDGLEATFEDENQIKVVNSLLEREKMWQITANTYRKAIDLIYEDKEIKK